jgi:hypothetical protein
MRTPWGVIPVVAIEDLVEIKKTNRAGDYDVITRLALIGLGEAPRVSQGRLRWALANVFRPEDVWAIVRRHGDRLGPGLLRSSPAAALLHPLWKRGAEPGPGDLTRAARSLVRRSAGLQARGRAYWLPRLAELRRLRAAGMIQPEGAPVTPALARGSRCQPGTRFRIAGGRRLAKVPWSLLD